MRSGIVLVGAMGMCVGIVLPLAATPAFAHHAFSAEFDAKKPVKLKGTVTKIEWINPHSWVHMDVKKPNGTVERWMIEAGTPNVLYRRGLTKESLKAGLEILVERVPGKGRAPPGKRSRHHATKRPNIIRRFVRYGRSIREVTHRSLSPTRFWVASAAYRAQMDVRESATWSSWRAGGRSGLPARAQRRLDSTSVNAS